MSEEVSTPSIVGAFLLIALFAFALVMAVRIGDDRRDCLDAGGEFVLSAVPFDRVCFSPEAVIEP